MARRTILGKLIYGIPDSHVEFDDRVLAHMKAVIVAKLRRNESFTLSWDNPPGAGGGRTSVWLHPAIPIQFEFYGNREPNVNRTWIDELMNSANSPGGMRILPEPQDRGATDKPPR